MAVDLPKEWSELAEDARIWMWASPKMLSDSEVDKVDQHLGEFVKKWTSHQVALKAKAKVFFKHFVVVALDQSASTGASGCSIDALTHEVQGVGRALHLDLLDRQTFYFPRENSIVLIKMSAIKDAVSADRISKDSLVFDTLVKTKRELAQSWIKPAKDSWHARFF